MRTIDLAEIFEVVEPIMQGHGRGSFCISVDVWAHQRRFKEEFQYTEYESTYEIWDGSENHRAKSPLVALELFLAKWEPECRKNATYPEAVVVPETADGHAEDRPRG